MARSFATFASLVTGGTLMVACSGKVVVDDGSGGAGGAISTVSSAHGNTGTTASGKTSGNVSAANVTTGSAASGASACKMAIDAIAAKAKQCGVVTGTGGDDQPCSAQQGAQLQAIAACYANASCNAITGVDTAGDQTFVQCLQNTMGS